jgi:hypothetical protein
MNQRKNRHVTHGSSASRNLPQGVAHYVALTILRTLSESSKASMMMTLLTRRVSYRLCSDDFISTAASQLELGSGAASFPPTAGPGAGTLCCVVETELLSAINRETPTNGGVEGLGIKSEAEE